MEKRKFEALMILLVPQIIELICENNAFDEMTAIDKFYSSEVYALLEQEDTKIWHFSPLTIYEMFREEQDTGMFCIPEEA